MSNNSRTEENGLKEIEKSLEPEYKQINKELKPLLWRILNPIDKRRSEIIQLKENAKEWYRRFIGAIQIGGKVSSLQKLILKTEDPQIVSTLKLFQYLGLVESMHA